MELKKQIAVDAYIRSFGIVTKAAKVAEISRVTFYDWLNTDKEFKHAIDNAQHEEYQLDFAENALMEMIKAKNVAATIFFLKTKGRNRGYIERLDVNNSFEAMPEVIILPASTAKPPVYDEADIIDPTEQ
jgi:hypothetical protein